MGRHDPPGDDKLFHWDPLVQGEKNGDNELTHITPVVQGKL